MGKNFNTNTDNNDEWLTPPNLIKSLGEFDLDPCSPLNRPWNTAKNHYNIIFDGLILPWQGRVWLNPPYGRETKKWLQKAAEHRNCIALIFARTETKMFHDYIWGSAHSIFFFKGRIKFCRIDGTQDQGANAPSCLVSWNEENTKAIRNSNLCGRLCIL